MVKPPRPNVDELDAATIDRVLEMAWEDRTPFEAIEFQFGLPEKEVIKLMRNTLKRSSFNLWRKRVNSGVSQKHLKTRNPEIDRFKCSRQKQISFNKISKR
ncbi:MAG: TIGR03643 family protein [Bacteroidota bacterium]